MSIPLKLVAANDTFAALLAITEMLAGRQAVFITPPEVNGMRPEVTGLPLEVGDEVGMIVESSGSTGTPKRIELSRAALVASATATLERLGGPGQWLLALPTNFIAGAQVLIRSALADTQPVMMNAALPFTADAFIRSASLMTAERRYTSLVPTQLLRLKAEVDQSQFALAVARRFDAILVGGQAADPALVDGLRALGLKIVITYGMTETSGGCVYDGVPLAGVDVELIDGRIAISGRVLANGLGERFMTSDLGETDASGKLTVLGRADRVIASGGIKLALDRVEEVARGVRGVEAAVAIGLANQEWGERVGVAYVGSPEVADDIATALAEVLGPIGRPVRVIRVNAIAQLANGKPDLITMKLAFEHGKN